MNAKIEINVTENDGGFMSDIEKNQGIVLGDDTIFETEINGKYTQFVLRDSSNAEYYRKAFEMGRKKNPAAPFEIQQTIEDFLPEGKKDKIL
jgi:hypothetical protein